MLLHFTCILFYSTTILTYQKNMEHENSACLMHLIISCHSIFDLFTKAGLILLFSKKQTISPDTNIIGFQHLPYFIKIGIILRA